MLSHLGVAAFFFAAFCFWSLMIYLMCFKPEMYIEWFLAKWLRSWGVSVSVTDKEKLKRKLRGLGFFLGAWAALGLAISLFAIRIPR